MVRRYRSYGKAYRDISTQTVAGVFGTVCAVNQTHEGANVAVTTLLRNCFVLTKDRYRHISGGRVATKVCTFRLAEVGQGDGMFTVTSVISMAKGSIRIQHSRDACRIRRQERLRVSGMQVRATLINTELFQLYPSEEAVDTRSLLFKDLVLSTPLKSKIQMINC